MMVVKFVLIASFFMHLRFESRLLSTVFYGGATLAIAVYLAVLSTCVFWQDSGNPEFNAPPPPQSSVAPETLDPATG